MKLNKKTVGFSLLGLGLLLLVWRLYTHPPLLHKSLPSQKYGDVLIAKPLWGAKAETLLFVDTHSYQALVLGQRLAEIGVTALIVDSVKFLQNFTGVPGECLDAEHLAPAIADLLKLQSGFGENGLIVSGIAQAALLPFINATGKSKPDVTNLSIDFSVDLPPQLQLCPPLHRQNQQLAAQSANLLMGRWLSVWPDQPHDETAVFIRALGNADTRIADYDTPLDTLLVNQIEGLLSQNQASGLAMPIVEVPAKNPGDSTTIFYSGDGGWRDLDRAVAGEMAAQQHPVLGVDVLRYFWKHKTPEQAAADLSATMQYYRQRWGIKTFVLAGYSFGADILPAVYNRLSPTDQNSVSLLVLLALSNHADFEIHVSGWLGQGTRELSLIPELTKIPPQKLLCVYGRDEKAETACMQLQNSAASILELPGGHHFDEDYPKLTRLILDVYRQHGIVATGGSKQ